MFDADQMEAEVLARIVDQSRWSPVIALLAGANLRFYSLVHRCVRKPGPWVKTGAWRPGILPASATPAGWCHGEGTGEEIRALAKAMRQAPEPGHLKLVADQPRWLARLVTVAKKIEGLVGLTLVAREAIQGSDLPLALMGMRLNSLTLGVSGHGTAKEWKDTLAAMKLDRLEVRAPIDEDELPFPIGSVPQDLRELVLHAASGQSKPLTKLVQGSSRLRRLDLAYGFTACHDDTEHHAWLMTKLLPTGLERLSLSRGDFLPKIAPRLEPTLVELQLTDQPRALDSKALYAAIAALRCLRLLDLSGTSFGARERDAQLLGGILAPLPLTVLRLARNEIGNADGDIPALLGHLPASLRTLDLSGNHLTIVDLRVLPKYLEGLDLYRVELSRNGLALEPVSAKVKAGVAELGGVVRSVRIRD